MKNWLELPKVSMVERQRFSLFNFEGITFKGRLVGGLAQLGERLPCKQEVSGSIPLISTKYGLIAQQVRAHA